MVDNLESNNNSTPYMSNDASETPIIFAKSFPNVSKIEVFAG